VLCPPCSKVFFHNLPNCLHFIPFGIIIGLQIKPIGQLLHFSDKQFDILK
jgi:glycopeptide antibiotics resistance protein